MPVSVDQPARVRNRKHEGVLLAASPGERQGLIDQAKRESSYTAEEIRLLEAPYE